jgi:hypothetical protein
MTASVCASVCVCAEGVANKIYRPFSQNACPCVDHLPNNTKQTVKFC